MAQEQDTAGSTTSSPTTPVPANQRNVSSSTAFAKFRKHLLADGSLLVEWEDFDEDMNLVTFKIRTAETIHLRAIQETLGDVDHATSPTMNGFQDEFIDAGQNNNDTAVKENDTMELCAKDGGAINQGSDAGTADPISSEVDGAESASVNDDLKAAPGERSEADVPKTKSKTKIKAELIDKFSFLGPSGNVVRNSGKHARFQWNYSRQGGSSTTVDLVAKLGIRVCAQRFLKSGVFEDLALDFDIVEDGQVFFASHYRGTPGLTELLALSGTPNHHNQPQLSKQYQAQQHSEYQAQQAHHKAQQLRVEAEQLHQAAVQFQKQKIQEVKHSRRVRQTQFPHGGQTSLPAFLHRYLQTHKVKHMSWSDDDSLEVKFFSPHRF